MEWRAMWKMRSSGKRLLLCRTLPNPVHISSGKILVLQHSKETFSSLRITQAALKTSSDQTFYVTRPRESSLATPPHTIPWTGPEQTKIILVLNGLGVTPTAYKQNQWVMNLRSSKLDETLYLLIKPSKRVFIHCLYNS